MERAYQLSLHKIVNSNVVEEIEDLIPVFRVPEMPVIAE